MNKTVSREPHRYFLVKKALRDYTGRPPNPPSRQTERNISQNRCRRLNSD